MTPVGPAGRASCYLNTEKRRPQPAWCASE